VTALGTITTPEFRRGDPDLIERARAGDEGAFETIFGQYRAAIYNYLYRQTGDPNDADDFTADTFLKAWLALPNTREELRVGAWLYRIATNVFLDAMRHRKLVQWQPWDAFISVFHPSQVAPDQPDRDAVRAEDAAEVRLLLERMNPDFRALLVLREFHDLSYDEIARTLTTTRAAVKSKLFRAREAFRLAYIESDRRPGVERDPANAPRRGWR
jgi:RNA polymerase sigma-70 factor (ECF subfamily)